MSSQIGRNHTQPLEEIAVHKESYEINGEHFVLY